MHWCSHKIAFHFTVHYFCADHNMQVLTKISNERRVEVGFFGNLTVLFRSDSGFSKYKEQLYTA